MCVCCPSGVVDKEAKTPHETCTYMIESCSIRGHHMLKDFCTPAINEVCSGSKEGKFGGRWDTCPEELQLLLAVFTDCNYYSYCKGQPSVFQ